jgi:hypothetical protein
MKMRYVHLVHFDTAGFAALPDAERQEIDRRALAKNAELEASGRLVLTEAIQSGENAVLIRVRDGTISVTDGPYVESKEQMAGFVLIEAASMQEAIALAAEDPLAEIGTIEVRAAFDLHGAQ